MKKLAAIFAVLMCTVVLLASVLVDTAAASDTHTYTFYDCSGPSPTTFMAVKTALPKPAPGAVAAAAAFRLIDGSATYVVLSYGQGGFSPPGISHSGNANVMCLVTFSIGTFHVSGLLAPPG